MDKFELEKNKNLFKKYIIFLKSAEKTFLRDKYIKE